MIDYQTILSTSIFSELAAKGIKAYANASVPDGTPTPYIIITDIDGRENQSNKSLIGHTVTVTFDCVTSFPINQVGGIGLSNQLAQHVMDIMDRKAPLTLNDDFQMLCIKLESDRRLDMYDTTQRVYRRLLTYSFIIKQLK